MGDMGTVRQIIMMTAERLTGEFGCTADSEGLCKLHESADIGKNGLCMFAVYIAAVACLGTEAIVLNDASELIRKRQSDPQALASQFGTARELLSDELRESLTSPEMVKIAGAISGVISGELVNMLRVQRDEVVETLRSWEAS